MTFAYGSRFVLALILGIVAVAVDSTAQLRWREFARLKQGRHWHVARYLPGDRVIVIGGWVGSSSILTGSPTATTEIIDLKTGVVTDGPSMSEPRTEFPSVVLPDGDIVVFSGYGSPSVERLDVQTMTWSVIGRLLSSRRQHAADFISADSILIFGGFNNSTAEIFNLVTRQSTRVRDLPSYANQAVSVNPDGRGPSYFGFRTGGANSTRSKVSLRYYPSTNRWEEDLVFDYAPAAPRVTALADGSVFVAGGALSEDPIRCSPYTWRVSPLGVVQRAPDLGVERVHQTMGMWDQRRALVAAGMTDDGVLTSSSEWIEFDTKRSVQAPTMMVRRCLAQMIMAPSADGRMRAFVISGLSSGANTPSVEVLEDTICMPEARSQTFSDMRLVGSARFGEQSIELTTTGQFQSGGAFLRNRVLVRNGFDMTFSFRLSDGNDNGMVDNGDPGADGIAVVFLPETPTALGRPGDGIGYHEIGHGMAVEYDSYLNPAYSDPNTSHIAVQVGDGRLLRAWHMPPYLRAMATTGVPSFKADGTVYFGRIAYEANRLSVYVSTNGAFDKPVIVVDSFDLQTVLNLDSRGSCFVGFTSSTGRSSEVHELLSVELTDCQPVTSVLDDQQGLGHQGRMTISPNPVTVAAQVQFPLPLPVAAMIELVDVHGRVILQQMVPAGATSQSLDSLGSVAPGMYYARLTTPDGITSSPLTIMR